MAKKSPYIVALAALLLLLSVQYVSAQATPIYTPYGGGLEDGTDVYIYGFPQADNNRFLTEGLVTCHLCNFELLVYVNDALLCDDTSIPYNCDWTGTQGVTVTVHAILIRTGAIGTISWVLSGYNASTYGAGGMSTHWADSGARAMASWTMPDFWAELTETMSSEVIVNFITIWVALELAALAIYLIKQLLTTFGVANTKEGGRTVKAIRTSIAGAGGRTSGYDSSGEGAQKQSSDKPDKKSKK